MSAVRLVSSQEALAVLAEEFGREPVLAVDTEAASFHRHIDRIYLIQVSTRTTTAIIDPVAVPDLAALGRMLADPEIEIVFHDADYDLRLFDLQYGFRSARIFDTRVAAELLNEPGLGLAALLAAHLGVQVDKRFQRADWSARPLSPEMLAYAAGDTQHLVALRDLMKARLEAAGRLAWAEEEFAHLTQVRWAPDEEREPGFLRIKGAKLLPRRKLAVLRELHRWRQEVAQRLDRAEFRIVGNEALLAIAEQAPTRPQDLGQIRGIGRDTLERRGEAILAAVQRALTLPDADLPKIERLPRRAREPEVEARVARLKEARTRVAERLGLAPGVACPNSILELIARQKPRSSQELAEIPGLRRWQVEAFGEELLAALRTP